MILFLSNSFESKSTTKTFASLANSLPALPVTDWLSLEPNEISRSQFWTIKLALLEPKGPGTPKLFGLLWFNKSGTLLLKIKKHQIF